MASFHQNIVLSAYQALDHLRRWDDFDQRMVIDAYQNRRVRLLKGMGLNHRRTQGWQSQRKGTRQ